MAWFTRKTRGTTASADQSYHSNLNYQSLTGGRGGSDSERKLAAIRLPDLKGKRFLDLGCNAGYFCAFARDSGARDVLGVDKSQKIIQIAREANPDIRFLDTGWDVFPEGEFDVIICLSAIHYAADPIGLADNIKAHLAPDGLFVLEGGLWGAEDELWSDVMLPVWREVGDKCRHFSRGYVARHALTGFDWKLLGRSINQGGDPLDRYVIHATPSRGTVREPDFRVCLLEFAKGLALSSPTIHAKQPSFSYVKSLGSTRGLSASSVEQILGDPATFPLFIHDLAFAVGVARLRTRTTLSESFLGRVSDALTEKKIELSW